MILIPVQNARQQHIFHQLLERNPYPLRMHPDAFGCIADSEHAHAFPRNETPFPQGLQGITASVIPSNHAQAGGTAVHGIKLLIKRERLIHLYSSHIIKKKGLYVLPKPDELFSVSYKEVNKFNIFLHIIYDEYNCS